MQIRTNYLHFAYMHIQYHNQKQICMSIFKNIHRYVIYIYINYRYIAYKCTSYVQICIYKYVLCTCVVLIYKKYINIRIPIHIQFILNYNHIYGRYVNTCNTHIHLQLENNSYFIHT